MTDTHRSEADRAGEERLHRLCREDAVALAAAWDEGPSLWPGVRARTSGRERARFGFLMTLTASTAAVAGLLVGVLLGPRGGADGSSSGSSYAALTGEWGDVGSLVADGAATTLDEIYLADPEEGGEQP